MNSRARCINRGLAVLDPPSMLVMDRLRAKLAPIGDGCLVFTGYIDSAGYGQMKVDGVARWVHRIAYAGWVGPIEDDQEIHHRCHRRACCAILHLEATTVRDNRRRTAQNGYAT